MPAISGKPHRQQTPWTALFSVFVILGAGAFLVPAFIITPFRYQSPRALQIAMTVADHAPFWTLVAAIASLVLALWLWNRVPRWQKIFLALATVLVAACATMARIDYFEWMFHPVRNAGFIAANQSKLPNAEMVMAVQFGNESRAYPIREMAYHHVLNDTVAGTPIVVTY